MKIGIAVAAAIMSLGLAPAAMAEQLHPFDYPQPEQGDEFFTVIEIPAGSFTKYEIDPDYGYIVVDRYQSMPVVYPANYGSIPSSLGGDGDPLDGMVFSREPIVPGAVIKVRAIGVLHMIDGGEQDDKIIAVPASKIDPTYDGIKSLDDLPEIERQRIEAFYRIYKQLPAGRKTVELNGFSGPKEAQAMLTEAFQAYRAAKK
ncbi:pyrophosphatase [Croceicoccus estronivorus]|uniref:inorganic diphosphatase n=1 Tax=Croceicoccus estronivorus TaxID=1172626 RepID=UPI00082CB82E|nr:inorganic diphosphatase [Croceicoccus estronivorus]OCC24940.1 pyrophosphatase [Croceicoccus estronivorus]